MRFICFFLDFGLFLGGGGGGCKAHRSANGVNSLEKMLIFSDTHPLIFSRVIFLC